MSGDATLRVRSLSLDELIALNDELAALVRAGVPLERTLGDMGSDLPGRLGQATTQLAERISAGASLPQALAAMPDAIPPVYRAAVEAGLRAGRLPVALEDLARSARRLADLRRLVALAALYPLLVILAAYGLFVLFVTQVVPSFLGFYEGRRPALIEGLVKLDQTVELWGPAVPVAAGMLAIAWWYRMTRSRSSASSLPIVGRMLSDARLASFAEILSLLVDH